ncbi:MAG: hypothetical protein HY953_08770 [Candidatus Rokubacteria bacterium]|nr:hypothetical protein [Candidatus Rokubacteria bacterium]
MKRVLALALLAACCAGAPATAAPPATSPPEPIALRHYFASRESNWAYRVSPDLGTPGSAAALRRPPGRG